MDKLGPREHVRPKHINELQDADHVKKHARGGRGLLVQGNDKALTLARFDPVKKHRASFFVRCYNDDTVQIDPYEPAVITGQIYEVDSPELYGDIVLTVRRIRAGTKDNPFVVVSEKTIVPGEIGIGLISGIYLVWAIAEDDLGGWNYGRLDGTISLNSIVLDVEKGRCELLWRDESVAATTRHLAMILVPAGGGGVGGLTIQTYTKFPPIPENPTLISIGQGLWYAEQGYTYWRPCVGFTDGSGLPGTTP